jgi:cytochrome P450
MTLFPEVQKKAQAEIDVVVGNDRLPSFSDRTQLPYVEALAMEVLRWHAVGPLGQFVSLSVIYLRLVLFQPFPIKCWKMTSMKGSSFLVVLWSLQTFGKSWTILNPFIDSLRFSSSRAMMRDERVYSTPSQFNPERYIPAAGKELQQDPRPMCFGFGRRICPGLNLADASLWISCAMSLAVFDITKAVENGVEIRPMVDSTPGTIR